MIGWSTVVRELLNTLRPAVLRMLATVSIWKYVKEGAVPAHAQALTSHTVVTVEGWRPLLVVPVTSVTVSTLKNAKDRTENVDAFAQRQSYHIVATEKLCTPLPSVIMTSVTVLISIDVRLESVPVSRALAYKRPSQRSIAAPIT
eukprot:TRINITY_DN4165_c0_g1_i1.p4 TRINITY_DN4165_c0_g1~~TRINITY_DN4165_c0_g1_i1.p4  ORF type:complete len:145 (-),score=5.45 TRINITY_DN4165_c0_g1_i1:563-997(-)